MLAAATCAAVIPATAASAKPSSLAITSLAGNSTGAAASFCEIDVVVVYSGKAKHADTVAWTIWRATDNSEVGGPVPQALGPSPFTPTGLAVQLPAGTYYFDVQLLANGSVLSQQKTSTFTTTATCPAAGLLATYP
jgi:hypothetical protein